MKHTIPSNVKPLVVAIALAGASAAVQAQPIVSLGGSLNVSAAASLSSSLPPLNTSQSLNVGYSGGMDIGFPAGEGDAVQSVISELTSDSSSDQSLPGLSLPGLPSGEGEASVISDIAAEASGTLEGLSNSEPSSQLDLSAAIETASEVAAKLSEEGSSAGDNAQPDTDTSDTPEDAVEPEDSDSGDDVVDQGNTQSPDGEVFASAVTETIAEVSGRLGGSQGQAPNMGLIVTGANRTAAEATARLRDAEPSSEDPSAPDAPEVDGAEIAAAAESQSEATAVASLN